MTTLSENDNPAISSLKSQIAHLEEGRDFWDTWYFWLIAGTALLIAATVTVQVVGRSVSKKLSLKQVELIREKDRQLSVDLGSKDVEIQAAKATASGANERAGQANEEAGKANERAARLEAESVRLRESNLAAEKSLEDEKQKRIELAVNLLPRDFRDQSPAIESMNPFAGTIAVVEYLNEQECLDMAEQINFVLTQAQWRTSGIPVMASSVREGIVISVGRKPLPPRPADLTTSPIAAREFEGKINAIMEARGRSEAIAKILAQSLMDSGIDANLGIVPGARTLPPTALVISIGRRPNAALEKALLELGPQPSPKTVRGQRQLNITSGQLNQMKSGSAQTDRLINETHALAENAGKQAENIKTLADAASAQVGKLGAMVDAANRQVGVISDQLLIMKKQLEATNRPWLSVDLSVPYGVEIRPNGMSVGFAVQMRNTGKSPAVNTHLRAIAFIETGYRAEDLVDRQQSLCQSANTITAILGQTIFPETNWTDNSGFIIGLDETNRYASENGFVIFVIGCVVYSASFSDEQHQTRFAYSLFNSEISNRLGLLTKKGLPTKRIGIMREGCCNDAF
jgi:hypothetical protein